MPLLRETLLFHFKAIAFLNNTEESCYDLFDALIDDLSMISRHAKPDK